MRGTIVSGRNSSGAEAAPGCYNAEELLYDFLIIIKRNKWSWLLTVYPAMLRNEKSSIMRMRNSIATITIFPQCVNPQMLHHCRTPDKGVPFMTPSSATQTTLAIFVHLSSYIIFAKSNIFYVSANWKRMKRLINGGVDQGGNSSRRQVRCWASICDN